MGNKQKATLLAVIAAPLAALAAISSANNSIRHIFIVLPLVIMAILLFFSGYFSGLAQSKK